MLTFTYRDKFLRKLDIAFLWDSKVETLKFPKKFEKLLHENGSIGWDKVHKCWVKGHFTGITDEQNDYTEYVCTTLASNVESYQLKNHEEVIVCGNNSMYTNDIDELMWYSQMLEETDISIYYQLVNSRNIPFVNVLTDAGRDAVKQAFAERQAGVPVVVKTGLLDEVKTLDITDPSSIDKIGTLDTFREELIKRWCQSYGIDCFTKEKKAQVNNIEMNGFDDWDTMNWLEMYEARLAFVEEMKENGLEIECIKNPVYWDEPTEEDIENGEYEHLEENSEEEDVENVDSTETNEEETDGKTDSDEEQGE